MRRFIMATAALVLIAPPGWALQQSGEEEKTPAEICQEYCGEKAAEHCDDIHSYRCGAYIWGCLAGCNLRLL